MIRRMEFSKAIEIVNSYQSISGLNETAKKAANMIIYCLGNKNWDIDNLVNVSGYSEDEIANVIAYLIENRYLFLDDFTLKVSKRNAPYEEKIIELFTIAIR